MNEIAKEKEASEKTFRLLKLNREYQARLQQQIETIRLQRAELERKKQTIVCAYNDRRNALQEEAIQFNINVKAPRTNTSGLPSELYGHINSFGRPKKLDFYNQGPVIRRSRKWSDHERQLLAMAIRQQNHEFIATTRMLEGKSPGLAGFSLSDNEVEREHRFLSRINWKRVAVGFLPNRTPVECMIRWVAHDHPLINKHPWSVEEDAMLRNIAKKHKERNWEAIALELKTNRTSWQCFKQHRSHLWEEQGRRKWTPAEDAILSQAVAMLATCFDNRTGQQCLHRWTKTLKPGMRKGRWNAEEDEALKNAVALHGSNNWVKVAAHVMERSDVQCRERWTNVLNPDIARGEWSAEEDKALLQSVAVHGAHSWATVAREMGLRRTDNHCWRRYKQLKAAGLVPQSILDSDRSYQRRGSEATPNTVSSPSIVVHSPSTPTTIPHKRKADVIPTPRQTKIQRQPLLPECIRMANKLVVSPIWVPALGVNCPQPWTGTDPVCKPKSQEVDGLPQIATVSRIPEMIDKDARYLKGWITHTKRNLLQLNGRQEGKERIMATMPPSEAVGMSLARTLECTNTVPDVSHAMNEALATTDPVLAARMEASPGLRRLSKQLKALYTWPMLLGQLDIKMQ
ncbi:hypothetical protein BDF19DRAFT_421846 [Syncephalis fuscata]|nr:hypothetical protein BDF19DRAFT_421846 [Syncephalis fuscata]